MVYTYKNVHLDIDSIYMNINTYIYIHIYLHMNRGIDTYHYSSFFFYLNFRIKLPSF